MHHLLVLLPCACCCRRWCGKLDAYSDVYDRVSVRAPATLGLHADRDFYYPRIMEDPVIQVRPTQCPRVTICHDLFGHALARSPAWLGSKASVLAHSLLSPTRIPNGAHQGPADPGHTAALCGRGCAACAPIVRSLTVYPLWCRGTVHQELASDEAEDKATVFASDAVVAHLMAASRAVNPWYVRPRRSLTCMMLDQNQTL
jgi:hypothetical protein